MAHPSGAESVTESPIAEPTPTMGGVRRASLLLLVPWLAVCTAQGTICSNEPTVCLGTYTGINDFRDHLCALPPPCLPRRTLTRREGGSTWGWHAAPTPPMSPPLPRLSAPLPLTPLTPRCCPSRSQVPLQQQPERQPAHAARRPHRADGTVRPPRSAAALPAAWGRQGGEGVRGGDGT